MDEIQNLDEYTVFIPVGNVTLPTPAVRTDLSVSMITINCQQVLRRYDRPVA